MFFCDILYGVPKITVIAFDKEVATVRTYITDLSNRSFETNTYTF
jgi:hypothetical protein